MQINIITTGSLDEPSNQLIAIGTQIARSSEGIFSKRVLVLDNTTCIIEAFSSENTLTSFTLDSAAWLYINGTYIAES